MRASSIVILCVAVAGAFAQTSVPNTTAMPTGNADNNKTTALTTTSNPTPAPTTTVPPAPTAGSWNVSKGENLCIMAKLGAQFMFSYTDATGKNQSYTVNLPSNDTSSNGDCDANNSTSQTMTLTFNGKCSMTMNFQKIKAKFSVNKIDINFQVVCFPDTMQPKDTVVGTITGKYFEATTGQSYMCNSDQTLSATSSQAHNLTVQFLDVQLQAFAETKEFKFGAAQECPQDAETSNIVPIAVGAALAALVLIVLIAYLISRNRGQRGYESV